MRPSNYIKITSMVVPLWLQALAVPRWDGSRRRTTDWRKPMSVVADIDRLGPQVGETVPSFSLADQHGAARDLQSLMGPGGLMLVFSRSADW